MELTVLLLVIIVLFGTWLIFRLLKTRSVNKKNSKPWRIIFMDTETTGFSPEKGHKIVEIGAVEMIDGVISEQAFHIVLNPERSVPAGASKVHGHTTKSLKDKHVFSEAVESLMGFIGKPDNIVFHNADFDVPFINNELTGAGYPPLPEDKILCTLEIARNKFPGAKNDLDSLCKRFGLSNMGRDDKHNALDDSLILAQVFRYLIDEDY